MEEIFVREYLPEDRKQVEKCIFELQADEYEKFPYFWAQPSETLANTYLDHTLKSIEGRGEAKIYVATVDDKAVGWVVVSVATEDGPDVALKQYGYVSEIAVLREFQGKGIGQVLMNRVEEFIKSKGLEWMELNVSEGNKALDFYLKLGYKTKSVRMNKRLNN